VTATVERRDGLLLVDKPAGMSSHDVVVAVRRATGERQVGHAGTLDPFATGLLVLLLGRATRLRRYLRDEPKEYEATVVFGAETDTEDAGGATTQTARLPTPEALRATLAAFHGDIDQVPPAYSAKRVGGHRAYELARAGSPVSLAPVRVHVHAIALSEFDCDAHGRVIRCRMRVSCGGGTYVRSLARDIARAAASAAHLSTLRRHRAGAFHLGRAVSLETLRAGEASVSPAIDAVVGHASQALTAEEVWAVSRGIDIAARVDGDFAALLDPAADTAATALVAFAQRRASERGDRWQPRVVFRDP